MRAYLCVYSCECVQCCVPPNLSVWVRIVKRKIYVSELMRWENCFVDKPEKESSAAAADAATWYPVMELLRLNCDCLPTRYLRCLPACWPSSQPASEFGFLNLCPHLSTTSAAEATTTKIRERKKLQKRDTETTSDDALPSLNCSLPNFFCYFFCTSRRCFGRRTTLQKSG